MIKKLKLKFIAVNMIIVTVMLAVIFGLVISFTKTNLEHDSLQLLRSAPVRPTMPGQPDDIHVNFNPLIFTVEKQPDGRLKAMGSELVDLSDEKLIAEIYEAALKTDEQTGVLEEYKLRFLITANPMIKSIAFTDITAENAVMEQLVRTCIFISVISLALFFVISLILARWTVKPIDTAWNQQKQFVADASHELKTPLTVIMTNAEMLQDKAIDEEKRMQFSENILTMSKQMRGLTESLLELARSDNRSTALALENTDFSRLVADVVLPFEPLYFEKGLTLTCEVENNIHVNADIAQLCRLVDILLDNAMKYSLPDSEVLLKLKRYNNSCVLSVKNCGETIPKADLKNIFKRFYRMDKARSMNHSYGLGLSIAESIAKQHNGKIWAQSENNTNTFFVKLPVTVCK